MAIITRWFSWAARKLVAGKARSRSERRRESAGTSSKRLHRAPPAVSSRSRPRMGSATQPRGLWRAHGVKQGLSDRHRLLEKIIDISARRSGAGRCGLIVKKVHNQSKSRTSAVIRGASGQESPNEGEEGDATCPPTPTRQPAAKRSQPALHGQVETPSNRPETAPRWSRIRR